MKRHFSAFLLLALAVAANASLGVGDQAPPLKVANYVKGEQVDLSKGTHVVEFWATWCGPCKESIPHLTELAKEFKGKVDFTGVSVWEEGQNQLSQVKTFVTGMGPKMDYNVAFDGDSKFMAKNWMEAANQNGIPAAFVVKDGVILWIGHPMDHLDDTLTKVTSGNYDVETAKKAYAAKQAAAEEEAKAQQNQQKELQPYMDALKAGNLQGQIDALDAFSAKHPELKQQIAMTKMMPQLSLGKPEGYAEAKKLSEGPLKDNAQFLNQVAWTIVQPKPAAKHPNYAFAVSLAKKAADISKGDPNVLDTYALALYKSGARAQAVQVEAKAVAAMKKTPGTSPTTLQECEARLASFKKG